MADFDIISTEDIKYHNSYTSFKALTFSNRQGFLFIRLNAAEYLCRSAGKYSGDR